MSLFSWILLENVFIGPKMEQCPVCSRIFASSNYLISHLHQSACRSALLPTNSGLVPTNSSMNEQITDSSICIVEAVLPSNDVVQRPMQNNAFGDIIIAENDENSDAFAVFSESEDLEDQFMPPPDPHDTNTLTDSGEQAGEPELSLNPISTILENESFNVPIGSDDKLIPMLKMIKAIRAAGAPLSLLDTLVKIIREEWQIGRMDITTLCTHKTAIRRICKMFPSLPTPISVSITHERTVQEMNNGVERPSLTFPKFSFLGQLQDLLDEHVFSDLQNLVVDPDNRWDHYKANSCPHSEDEIQDGRWFQNIVQKVHRYPETDSIKNFVFGIQGYVDKTGTDAYQRTAVEPFVFTLTLFTNQIRNSDVYWRVMALLPASLCQQQRKKHSFGASVRNYHIALHHAFAEFIDLQKNPPIVRLRLGDQFQNVRAHLFWVNTIADGLANESLTGRIQNRHSSPRLSRGCHCPQHLADRSDLVCKYIQQTAIERLSMAALGPPNDGNEGWKSYIASIDSIKAKRAAESALKTRKKIAQSILNNVFGQHVVDLVWFHVDQGPNPRGCFGSTPVDPMHAIEEGIIPNIMSVILDPLPESAKSSLDALAVKIIACNRWDSDYPRMNFSGGFCSLTQLTADEKVGKMLLLWIIMQTTIGRDILGKRCSPTFDEHRVNRAARFTSNPLERDDVASDEDTESPNESCANLSRQHYTGTASQIGSINNTLQDHGLKFLIPWINEMIPFHQDVARRVVFEIDCTRGKGHVHRLPQASFLDRRAVDCENEALYFQEHTEGHISPQIIQERSAREAQFSIDCNIDELQSLIEMVLSFHASYKYSHLSERVNFEANVRLMMSLIKQRINRGRDTMNWAISKFHDILHMVSDSQNFGSHANIDAGKGEHGLKKWAKLPSKTVRTRQANQYYQDMATRIYENRLIELAMSTLVPRTALTENVNTGDHNDDANVNISLSNLLMKMDVNGPSLLSPELTAFLRGRPNLVFPIEIYQEAQYSINGGQHTTIRGTPTYRNSGPWYDCVMVNYENNGEYPFQVLAFFSETTNNTCSAVGLMGMNKKKTSRLLDEWSYEKQYRIVDLETTSRAVFALSIPLGCYKENSRSSPHRMFVLKDRISEWPAIFNDWKEKDQRSDENKRKRKARR